MEFHKSPELLSDTVPLALQSTQLLWLIVPGSQTSKESFTLLVFASSFTLDQPPTTLANKLWDRLVTVQSISSLGKVPIEILPAKRQITRVLAMLEPGVSFEILPRKATQPKPT